MPEPGHVYILSAARTPIGSFLGTLAPLSAPLLGAAAIRAAVARAQIDPEQVQHVLMGNVLQAGVGQAPARQASILGGLPHHVGATTINKVCGSGMRALMDATNAISTGEWDVVVAGGMESMSNAPHFLKGSRALRMGDAELIDSMIHDGLWDPYGQKHMGSCAEACARKYGLTRELQDAFAVESYRRAQAAWAEGSFQAELVGVDVPGKKGTLHCDRDEEPFKVVFDKVPSLRPAFETDDTGTGTITAANASKLNDGASALVLCSERFLRTSGRTPIARVVSQASAAQDPEWFTTATVPALQGALQRAQLAVRDIQSFEINEAFAVVALAAQKLLELDPRIVNVSGGAVALGHPIGCSGARIVTTLLHGLVRQGLRLGAAAICIGGGEGTAMVFERL